MAAARHERRLLGVGSTALFGPTCLVLLRPRPLYEWHKTSPLDTLWHLHHSWWKAQSLCRPRMSLPSDS